jgi:hypothetical protein
MAVFERAVLGSCHAGLRSQWRVKTGRVLGKPRKSIALPINGLKTASYKGGNNGQQALPLGPRTYEGFL